MAARNEQDHDYEQIAFDGLVPPQPGERVAPDHAQHTIFKTEVVQGTECTERLVRIEGCQVVNPPVVARWEEKAIIGVVRKKQWTCTFVAPPDLWNQERSDWIQAVTESKEDIPVLNKLRLNNGDMCTVIGIQTGQRDEPMAKGNRRRHITFVKVTAVIPGIRGSSRKANVVQPKARQG